MRKSTATPGFIKRRIGWFAAALLSGLAVGLSSCASTTPALYSLDDPEIFVSPKPSPLNVAVAVFYDRRPSHERDWARKAGYPSDLSVAVTRRMVEHLRRSSLFGRVEIASDQGSPPSYELSRDLENDASGDRVRLLAARGFDAVLAGDLVNFSGKTESDRQIEGHVRFEDLKLYSTHTGQLLWQGEVDKLLRREERRPGRDAVYASEALRGAINQLAMRLAGLSYSPDEAKPLKPSKRPDLRLGVLIPEDLRPRVETDSSFRKNRGDEDDRAGYSENKPFTEEASEKLVEHLMKIGLFEEVRPISSHNVSEEELRQWASEGLDLVLSSRLTTGWSSARRPTGTRLFPLWSGGMAYPPRFRMTAMVRLDDIQLIQLSSGRVLWRGDASHNIDRLAGGWNSPNRTLEESLEKALQALANRISREIPRLMDEINAAEVGLKTYPDTGQ